MLSTQNFMIIKGSGKNITSILQSSTRGNTRECFPKNLKASQLLEQCIYDITFHKRNVMLLNSHKNEDHNKNYFHQIERYIVNKLS